MLAHGSRHSQLRASLDALAAAVASRGAARPGPDPEIEVAFLDLAEPTLAQLAADLAKTGYRRAVVVPLLFAEAFHARTDVPAAVAEASDTSGLDLTVTPILGTGSDLLEVLLQALAAAKVPTEATVMVYAVGSSDPSANASVADLAGRLARHRGRPDFAAFATRDPRGVDRLGVGQSGAHEPEIDEAEVDPSSGGGLVVLPLFVAPGLLLDTLVTAAAAVGVRVLDPLGAALAPVIRSRYAAALGHQS